MLETTTRQHFRALIEARDIIGIRGNHSDEHARHVCSQAYGRPIGRKTWGRWKKRALVFLDPPENGDRLSEASFLSLWAMAGLLRGNTQKFPRNQVSRLRLAQAMISILNGAPKSIPTPPENISCKELRELAELQALRRYSERYHRMQGIKKSRLFYSRAEALQILSKYPDHRIKNNVEFEQDRKR